MLLISVLLATSLLLPDCAAQSVPEPPEAPQPPRFGVGFVRYEQTAQPDDATQERTELRRRLIKSYPVTAADALTVDNSFGDVTVTLWPRNEMRVEVSITVASQDPEQAKKYLDAVDVVEDKKDNVYSFRTVIADGYSSNRKRNDRHNSLRIDYRVSMPKANALTVRNNFGNVTIPDFSAPLSVITKFGNVYGAALSNAATSINAQFGNVSLRDVQNGKVNMSFGDLDISSGNVLLIDQKHGKLRIGETNRVDARMSYGDAVIGAIRQSGKLNMNYTKLFQLNQLAASADQLDVTANFSSVALPVQSQTNCDFDVTITHGGFTYPSLPTLRLTAQPGVAPAAAHRPGQRQQYTGRVGTGEGPRIRVVSVFGDVKFK